MSTNNPAKDEKPSQGQDSIALDAECKQREKKETTRKTGGHSQSK